MIYDRHRSGLTRIYRLYREEGLSVRKHRGGRRAVGTRVPILPEARPNARWSLIDYVTRECLAAIPDTSIPGRRVARVLTALLARRGKA